MIKPIPKYIYIPLLLLFGLLPFHAFLSTFFNSVITDGLFSASNYVTMGNPFIESQPYLPYHTITKPLFFLFNPSFYLVVWKELLCAFITFAGIFWFIKNKHRIKPDLLDYTVFFFFFLGILAFLFREFHVFEAIYGESFIITSGLKEIIYGIKYDFIFLILFLVLKHLNFSDTQKKNIITVTLWSASITIIYGLLLQFVLPADFLIHFGYYARPSYFNPLFPISYCQQVGLGQGCRVQSTISGPNQLGAYLTIILPLFFMMSLEHWKKNSLWQKIKNRILLRKQTIIDNFKENKGKILMFYLGLVALFFTYSRAAILGIILGIFAYFFCMMKNKRKLLFWLISALFFLNLFIVFFSYFNLSDIIEQIVQITRGLNSEFLVEKTPLKRHAWGMDFLLVFSQTIWVSLMVLFMAFLFLMPKKLKSILLLLVIIGVSGILGYGADQDIIANKVIRFSSLQGHYERSMDGVMYIGQFPVGLGLGRAGPASSRMDVRGIGLLPESWYIQMGLEFGILGIITFIAILALIAKKLLKQYKETEPNTITNSVSMALFIGLIALSVNALKLHTFEDAAVALTFWGLLGVFYSLKEENKT